MSCSDRAETFWEADEASRSHAPQEKAIRDALLRRSDRARDAVRPAWLRGFQTTRSPGDRLRQWLPAARPPDAAPRPSWARLASFGEAGFVRRDWLRSVRRNPLDANDFGRQIGFARRTWLRAALGFRCSSWLRSTSSASFRDRACYGATRVLRRDLRVRSRRGLRRGDPSAPGSRLDPGMGLTALRLAKDQQAHPSPEDHRVGQGVRPRIPHPRVSSQAPGRDLGTLPGGVLGATGLACRGGDRRCGAGASPACLDGTL